MAASTLLDSRALWYLTRGSGLVALVLLSAAVVLGVATVGRWRAPGAPAFATQAVHRNISLLVMVFLGLHILTAEADTFAPIGWAAVLVPFVSPYRPIWLGLGTVAFDLLIAVVATSLVRRRLGYRAWKALHWAAYASWPVAVVHGLGTGSDARLGAVQLLTLACVAAVVGAVAWRLAMESRAGHSSRRARWAGGTATAASVVGLSLWAAHGPLRPGWAAKAGTPASLLAGGGASAGRNGAPSGAPAAPFESPLAGRLSQQATPAGMTRITLAMSLETAPPLTMTVTLTGSPSDGGVQLASSSATFGPASDPSLYTGAVSSISGSDMTVSLVSAHGQPLTVTLALQISSNGSVTGTAAGQDAASQAPAIQPSGGRGDDGGGGGGGE